MDYKRYSLSTFYLSNKKSMIRFLLIPSILLSGKDGGRAVREKMADINYIVPGPNTARIQECHAIFYHTLCYAVEKQMVDEGVIKYRG